VVPVLLCDLDDTLVSRRSTFARWADAYLTELGAPEDVAWFVEIDDDGTRPRDEFYRLVIDRYGLAETTESLAERYYRDFVSSFRCEPEVIAALQDARKAGFKVAIVTNGGARAQPIKIAAAGLGDFVDASCISEAEGYWKPAVELFELAAQRCGCSLDGAWMIGDNPVADIGGAIACGARSVWIRMGRTWPEDLGYRPDFEADEFHEAVSIVLQQITP